MVILHGDWDECYNIPILDKYIEHWEDTSGHIQNNKFNDPQYEIFKKIIEDKTYEMYLPLFGGDQEFAIRWAYVNKICDIVGGSEGTGDGILSVTDLSVIGDILDESANRVQKYIATEEGAYAFADFIPGNYIVRFIYGDGSTYDVTADVEQYNGQDYKSTIDKNYKEQWYNGKYETDKTVSRENTARDNEARRLEVMGYSILIDEAIGKALDEKTALDKTWMAAETSRINIPIDAEQTGDRTDGETAKGIEPTTIDSKTAVSFEYRIDKIEFSNMNFGLVLRPETNIELEKHITGLKLTPNGVGVQPVVEARAEINDIISNTNIPVKGLTDGLSTIKSERNNRGFWKVETDIEELAQGAELEVEYTYVIRNLSNLDYLSAELVGEYESKSIEDYAKYLKETKKNEVKDSMRNGTYAYSSSNRIGKFLGNFYYTGTKSGSDTLVLSRMEELKEAVNNDLKFNEDKNTYFDIDTTDASKVKYNTDGNAETITIDTVVKTIVGTEELSMIDATGYPTIASDKTIKLTTVLSSLDGNEGGQFASYIAEVTKYSNAAGRRDMQAEPQNLTYVHSDDTSITLETLRNNADADWYDPVNPVYITITEEMANGNIDINEIIAQQPTLSWVTVNLIKDKLEGADKTSWDEFETLAISTYDEAGAFDGRVENLSEYVPLNEIDEFWGESIIITKPTGEDKQTGLQIGIIIAASVALVGVGIILIKKFVLK